MRPVTMLARFALVALALLLSVQMLSACGPTEDAATVPPVAAEDTGLPTADHDPAILGASYPLQYETWLRTSEERPAGKSAYKRGFDGGRTFDKLSEFPFMPLLFNGWGFGIEYNEPRGHYYMLVDQSEIDPTRVKSGGACLTCKTPYAQDLYERDPAMYFAATYAEAVSMIPEKHRTLGVTCIDCHDAATMDLATRRWTVDAALTEIGVAPGDLSLAQRRLLVCGQCHCTYSVMKDGSKVLDVDFPWEGGEWGAITVEDVIANLEEQPHRLEWTQAVTGMKVGFIRHPDVEFFTAGSTHFEAGVTCPDCHMPDISVNNQTATDHNAMSPLKKDMVACQRCHADTPAELRGKVLAIQEANLARLIDAGYRTATVAKLIELANESLETSSAAIKPVFDEARAHYRQALYRVIFMGAENSVGFHNPAEGARILADAAREADAADALLRQLLTANGVSVPAEVPLELRNYTDDRGAKKLDFDADAYIPDPSGAAGKRWPKSLAALMP